MKKKLYSAAMTMLLAISLSFFACGGGGAKSGGANVDAGLATSAGTYPITKSQITLTVLGENTGAITDWQTNRFSEWLEDKTGVHAEYTGVDRANKSERINTLIASGDLPDIIISSGFSLATVKDYGEEGLLLDMRPYIDKYGSVIKEVFKKKPVVEAMISDLDSRVFVMPRITECYHCFRGPKVWYYQPFVDKLKLEIPQTTEEFYNFLKAIKEGDPNGNGIADEIPYTGSNIGWDESDIIDFIVESYLYAPSIRATEAGMYLDNGKVKSAYTQDAYREALRFLHRLYQDGLITDLTFTMAINDYKRTVESDTPIVGVAQSNYPGVFADYGKDGRGYKFFPLSPLEGPEGVRYANLYTPYQGVIPDSVITYKNKYPAVSFRWLETFMLPEATMKAQVGFEGIDWWKAPAGVKDPLGDPAAWVSYDPDDPWKKGSTMLERNSTWQNQAPTVNIRDGGKFSFVGGVGIKNIVGDPNHPPTPRGGYEGVLGSSSKENYEPYAVPVEKILPPLTIAREISDETTELRTSISSYMQSEATKFIRGEKDLDADWDSYIADLNNKLQLPKLLEIYQKQYEAEKDRWQFFRS